MWIYGKLRTFGAFRYSAPIVRTQQRTLILNTLHELLYPEDAATTLHPTARTTGRYGDSLRAGRCGYRIPVGVSFFAPTQTGRGVYPVTGAAVHTGTTEAEAWLYISGPSCPGLV